MTSQPFFVAKAINRLQFGFVLAVAIMLLSLLLPRALWAEGPHSSETANGSGKATGEINRPVNDKPKRELSSVKYYQPAAQDIADALDVLNRSSHVGEQPRLPTQPFPLRQPEVTAVGEKR